ncbi:MnmC family methyltransferase [Sulfurovum sp.]|uniref:tRNA (5-methylaminomethyl-2-thiouridine)(34)-methyltransferase MnmD n=1 Tax=Sulfurovum sp. TaxID=1969726 RepID=UPI0025D0355D|nr:MnmC family methyltransferase [Sulfurovum sp.]
MKSVYKVYNETLRSQKELILCEDGTNTLYSKEFDEPYHSTKDGALHESLEKHVKPSLSLSRGKTALIILDICFGLGYNTFATLYYIKKNRLNTKVHILSPEFDEELVHSLRTFEFPPEFDMIKHMIEAVSENLRYEDEQFKIEILPGDARKSIPQIKEKIDVVYQDAFSPAHNPLLWTKEWFSDVRAICREDALLTTYSTAAAIRLGLYENGFFIFVHRAEMMRYSTVASLKMLDGLEYIDMELKKKRNPTAESMKDKNYV